MKDSGEEVTGGRLHGLIEEGETVSFRGRHFGFMQSITSKITAMAKPLCFKDVMISGAFKRWEHVHSFEQKGERTLMTDHIEYESPFGIFGKIADAFFLNRYMKMLIQKRNQVIKNFAESEQWKQILNA
ncbi:MAG: SRPBCC family protein [Flavobacteriales bacterium]